MRVVTSIQGAQEAAAELTEALDLWIRDALVGVATRVALAARVEHSFTNRTGDLEASFDVNEPRGTFSKETLSIAIVARTKYASYLEGDDPSQATGGMRWYPGPDGELMEAGKWSYLARAWSEHAAETQPLLDAAINDAIKVAGW